VYAGFGVGFGGGVFCAPNMLFKPSFGNNLITLGKSESKLLAVECVFSWLSSNRLEELCSNFFILFLFCFQIID